jgi:toxin ParE1/3/4
MPRFVYRTPQAKADLIGIALHIAEGSERAAMRFLDSAEATFKSLARKPELGHLGEFRSAHLIGVRRWRVNGFKNYLIFYREREDGVEIVRVLHGARDIEAVFDDER